MHLRALFQVLPDDVRNLADALHPGELNFHGPERTKLTGDFLLSAKSSEFASRDDGDAVADMRQLWENVAGHDEGFAASGQVQ